MSDDLLKAILAKCDRGDCRSDKWPDSKGDYWPLSPLRADAKSGSFSVGPRGWIDFSSGERGGLRDLAGRLGITTCAPRHVITGGKQHTHTLAAYAKAKNLPLDFLAGLGLVERKIKGEPVVCIPYLDTKGQEIALRYRFAAEEKGRFRWQRGSKTAPYGLWRLADAHKAGGVILVEGESDAQTLWYHGLPALGIPGAATWKSDWADFLDGLKVYVWQEPDEGGTTFAAKIGGGILDAGVMTPPSGIKDVSEAHILGHDVRELVQDLMHRSRPWRDIAAEQRSEAAREAKRSAGDLLTSQDILAKFEGLLPQLGLSGETENAKLIFLALTSRLLARPVSLAVKGPSAAGKSFVVETVLRVFPECAYYALSSLSERALVYDETPLSHKTMVIYEASGMSGDFGTYLMRSLLSEGCVRYVTVEKTDQGLQAKHITREGPTNLITTTTWASLHPENETRLLSLTVRDDPSQTAGILAMLAGLANGDRPMDINLERWHALQTWLELAGCREVSIPFAHDLAAKCDPKAVRLRRDFGVILTLIKTHAILHQANRERDRHGRIAATLADYEAVYSLVRDIIAQGVQATVSPTTRETVAAVRALIFAGAESVSAASLTRELQLDRSAVNRRVRVAISEGYLVNLDPGKGKPAKLILGDELPEDRDIIPEPSDLEGMCVHVNPPEITCTGAQVETAPEDTESEPGEGTAEWDEVTLLLPGDTRLPLIGGKWNRLPNGEIQAQYSRDELEVALGVCERAENGVENTSI